VLTLSPNFLSNAAFARALRRLWNEFKRRRGRSSRTLSLPLRKDASRTSCFQDRSGSKSPATSTLIGPNGQ
jgi:hypothetical protein